MKKNLTHIIFTALLTALVIFFASYKNQASGYSRLASQQINLK